jgi:hypothetical protein
MNWKKGDLVNARADGDAVLDFLQLNFEILSQEDVEGADLMAFSMRARADGADVIREIRQLSASEQLHGHEDFLLLLHAGRFFFIADAFELTDAFDFELMAVESELTGSEPMVARRWGRIAVVSVEVEDTTVEGFLHCDFSDEEESESEHLRRLVVAIAQSESFDADLVTMGRRLKPLFSIPHVADALTDSES